MGTPRHVAGSPGGPRLPPAHRLWPSVSTGLPSHVPVTDARVYVISHAHR